LALHYTLEMLWEFTPEALVSATEMLRNRYGFILSEDEIRDICVRIERLLENETFLFLLQNATYKKEKALRYKKSLRYIDLLIKKEDGNYIVVDYKSAMNFTDKHLTQIRSYVQAVKQITGATVEGYLCYLLGNSIKFVKV